MPKVFGHIEVVQVILAFYEHIFVDTNKVISKNTYDAHNMAYLKAL